MSEQLIIRLGSQADEPIWWLAWAVEQNEVIASGRLNHADDLIGLAERIGVQRPLTVLVPACDVLLKTVTLPSKPNRQLLQALPYMLEEEQAEDIDSLLVLPHQALPQGEQYVQQVAVVRRALLEQWISWVQQAGFNLRQLLPDALLLPNLAQATAIELGDQWLLRQGDWQVSCVDRSWWADFLQLANPSELLSYSPWPAELAAVPHQLAPAELPLQLLAQQLPEQSFSLLQGEYTPKRPQNKYWQQWRLSASLALVCLLSYLVVTGLHGYQAGQQADLAREQAEQLFKQRFPQERVVNLRRQVERKLAASGGNPEATFTGLLALLQPPLSSVQGMTLDNLRFDNKKLELRFQATAADFAAFEQLKSKLQQQGLQVEQGALSQIEGKVQGTLAIRGKV